MSFTPSRAGRWLASGGFLVLLAGHVAAQFPNGAPCWESNLGTPLSFADDSIANGQPLGFAFPLPGGGTTSTIDIVSNGYVWLGTPSATDDTDYTPTVAEFLSEPPRIAAYWADLVANSGTGVGDVYFNTFPGRAVVTWDGLREIGTLGAEQLVRCQLQLVADGSFTLTYETTDAFTRDIIVGITPGNGATDPGEVDFTGQPPISSGSSTMYELISYPNDPQDMEGLALVFLPTSPGYVTTHIPACQFASATPYGQGCPEPSGGAAYEFFTSPNEIVDTTAGFSIRYVNTGNAYALIPCTSGCWEPNYSNAVTWNGTFIDDAITTPLSLGFTAPIAGTPVTTIEACSNGYIWFTPATGSATAYLPDVDEFLSDSPRLAALWTDMNPSVGGTVYFDTFPGRAVVTWDNVPEYANPGNLQQVQAQIFQNGDIVVTYQSVTLSTHDALVGFSVGGGMQDPGESDITMDMPIAMPFVPNPFALHLALASGQTPDLGSSVTFETTELPSQAAVLLGGLQPVAIDLTGIGMPGCFALVDPLATAGQSVTSGVASLTLPVPQAPGLVGASVYFQSVALAQGVNALGLVSSNGLRLNLGY